jgi:hypothetical protein
MELEKVKILLFFDLVGVGMLRKGVQPILYCTTTGKKPYDGNSFKSSILGCGLMGMEHRVKVER